MSQQYSVRHVTRFRYSEPIRESVMELRQKPLSDGHQRCLSFQLRITPSARPRSYQDHLGNTVHHFNIPQAHQELVVVAESQVFLGPTPELPDWLDGSAWDELDAMASGDLVAWEFLSPSPFTGATPLLEAFAEEVGARRRDDPLTVLRELNQRIYRSFQYRPRSTRVDSPIDEALESRAGVCQDFAHIMLALIRPLGIPARYVSGYLFHRREDQDRSEEDASHAWVEALLPGLGWVGFDPTNRLIARDRHIRAAVGCDYSDVPPSKGVFKGKAQHDLSVAVQVRPSGQPLGEDEFRDLDLPHPDEPDTRSPFLDAQPQQQ